MDKFLKILVSVFIISTVTMATLFILTLIIPVSEPDDVIRCSRDLLPNMTFDSEDDCWEIYTSYIEDAAEFCERTYLALEFDSIEDCVMDEIEVAVNIFPEPLLES